MRYDRSYLLHIVILASILFTSTGSPLFGQERRPPPPNKFTLAVQQTTPSIGVPSVAPTAIPFTTPSDILVTVQITDSRLLPNSVFLNHVDTNGNLIATLGILNDGGVNGDATAGDHIFSGRFTISEAVDETFRLRVSAAFRGILQRVQSDVFSVNVQSGLTVFNAAKDLWALNMGTDGIAFNFADVPSGTTNLKISRATSITGPWSIVIDVGYSDSLPQPLLDLIDGTLTDYYYKMEAFNADSTLLKTYGTVLVPRYRDQTSTLEIAGFKTFAVTPIYNTEWITDAIYEDTNAMTVYQIRDILSDKGSFLATPTINDTIADTDGVQFSPAQTIAQMAATYSINPQLILVSLQKESQSITASVRPQQPPDGWMGAKSCALQTIRGQLDCGVSRFRKYLTDLDTNGQTVSGWKVGVAKTTSDNISVTPANRAIAALFTYTPWVGQAWGGQQGVGGTALNYAVWTPTLFGNIVHILKWKTCSTCPQNPEVVNQGWRVDMGVQDRQENGNQASSYHSVSAGLPANASYAITFECDLKTWDSYNADTGSGTGYWDSFSISVTPNRYWLLNLSDPITFASYLYGGGSYGDGILKKSGAVKKSISVNANPNSVTYLNVMLDTATLPAADTNYPSWGTCTVKKVKPATSLGIFSAPN